MKTNLKTLACGLLLATAVSPIVTSCNSDEEITYTLPTSATVRSFALAADKSVLPNLDSVFFSIDLYSLEIFNADSLPYGTPTNKLVPVILTDGAQLIELSVPRPNSVDTVYNYLENTTDSVDFSNGPVKMRVVSVDGKTERNYTIKVNVHTVPTDTLVWTRLDRGNLPTTLSAVNEQHTAMSPDGNFYCLTRYQTDYSMCTTTDPSAQWSGIASTITFDADINSLTATNDALYILDKEGNMYTSKDKGATWSPTGEQVADILGAYRNKVLLSNRIDSQWCVLEYPGGINRPVPTDFPVRNSSTALTVSYEMELTPQLVLVGGRKADGTVTNTSWGYDGSEWANITKRPIAEPLENLCVVPYFDVQPDSVSWRVSSRTTVLLAMFGNRADGMPNDTVYMSKDFGMHWDKAPANMQISTKVIPSRTHAQAYPHTAVVHAAKKAAKNNARNLFINWADLGYGATIQRRSPASRATSPITEWNVPYLYLFGGVNAQGTTFNTVYRGAITSLTLKPLQ